MKVWMKYVLYNGIVNSYFCSMKCFGTVIFDTFAC